MAAEPERGSAAGPDEGEVNLEAIIAEFIDDADKVELELPRSLTAAQRKEAKRLADQHEALKCESYGFGEDRRLHLFKKEARKELKVKNTFIDGWENDGGDAGEAPAFRSMPVPPVALLERTLERCHLQQTGSASASAPGQPSEQEGLVGGSPSAVAELPPMPDGVKVRNTFIHIESVPEVERIVQTMPDGMFRQALNAELAAQRPQEAPGAAPAAPPPPVPPPAQAAPAGSEAHDAALVPGTEVIIQGLVKLPDFNGLTGVVQSLDAESMRFDVLLDGPAGQCGWRWVKVKGENCRLKIPPAPLNAPTLSLDNTEGEEIQGPGDIPPTPHWEEDVAEAGGAARTGLRLDALV